ncbi:hypothetical protein Scep_027944 [Stephania cephalantha]|uniref:Uncharacterized protein n=1 Tax=Stephania cephalantha TaxID=152367 RepID=A0AAP0EDK5_9MAGN
MAERGDRRCERLRRGRELPVRRRARREVADRKKQRAARHDDTIQRQRGGVPAARDEGARGARRLVETTDGEIGATTQRRRSRTSKASTNGGGDRARAKQRARRSRTATHGSARAAREAEDDGGERSAAREAPRQQQSDRDSGGATDNKNNGCERGDGQQRARCCAAVAQMIKSRRSGRSSTAPAARVGQRAARAGEDSSSAA